MIGVIYDYIGDMGNRLFGLKRSHNHLVHHPPSFTSHAPHAPQISHDLETQQNQDFVQDPEPLYPYIEPVLFSPSGPSSPSTNRKMRNVYSPSIFDNHIDATYMRPSGLLWPDWDAIPQVPYKNRMIYSFVHDVYDGDTFNVMIFYGEIPMRCKIRLAGVDAPELVVKKQKGKVYSSEEEYMIDLEQRAGAHVRDKVKKLIEGKEVIIKIVKPDKYCRFVASVYIKPQAYETLTEYLLMRGYGKPYEGKKKEDWTKDELERILLS